MSLSTLLDMLTYCRPAGSEGDRAFRQAFLAPLPGAYVDQFNNYHVQVGSAEAPILFSTHTDSVHWKSGRQTVAYNSQTGMVKLSRRSRRHSSCLGADDAAGCYLLMELIKAGIPGRYIFHFGEECGGIGSSALVRHHHDWLRQFSYAVAFDRRGTADVITHQAGMRCCSQDFAYALSDALGQTGTLDYLPSSHGIFTDTANYLDTIPECTNISVGYYDEHRRDERLNVAHLMALRNVIVSLDWTSLPVKRDPAIIEPEPRSLFRDIWPDDVSSTVNPHGWVFTTDDEDTDDDDELTWKDQPSLYLDPEYAEIQRLLRRGMLRLKG